MVALACHETPLDTVPVQDAKVRVVNILFTPSRTAAEGKGPAPQAADRAVETPPRPWVRFVLSCLVLEP